MSTSSNFGRRNYSPAIEQMQRIFTGTTSGGSVLRECRYRFFRISSLRSQHCVPSQRSMLRWVDKNDQDNFQLFRRSGNKWSEREILGNDLLLLLLYRISLQYVTPAEVSTFLVVMNEHDPIYVPYSSSQISRAEDVLNLTRKRGCATAFQAYDPLNLQWRDNYWNILYPYDMVDIEARDIIDSDEARLQVVSSNRRHVKAHKCKRVREAVAYSKSGNVNLLLAMSGDPDNPDR